MSRAQDLLANAPKDPTTVLAAAEAYLGELTVDEHAERSISHRAASIAARPTDIDKAVDHGEMAMACARDGGWEELRLGAALTLAGSYAIAGRSGEALELLEGEDPKGYPLLRARFLFQKGALLQHVGRVSEATDAFEGVLPQFRESGDVEAVAMTANRLGMLMTSLGRLREAEVYLGEALGIQEELGHHAAIHGTHHNLGMVAAFQGDIPLALDRLQRSDELFMKTTGATAPQHVARCVVLANVGLFAEAERLATRVAYACRDRGDSEHEGNALLVASHSALLGTRYERAKGLADRAGAIFSEDGRKPSALDATRVSLDARFALEGASMGLLEEVEEVARRLSAASDPLAAAQSDLLAGRIALELGLHDRARASLQKSAGVHHGTLEVRLNAQLARALVAISEGDSRRADASARAGIKLIDDYQRTLGATDLRMGLDRQAAELGELGLGLALESGSPRRVLAWMERSRARALRFRPVVPDSDEQIRSALANLRQIEFELRSPESRGDERLQHRLRDWQDRIQEIDRVKRSAAIADERFSVRALIDELGDRMFIELAEHNGVLWAVVVKRGRARLHELGPGEGVRSELSHLRFAMRRAARRGRHLDRSALDALDEIIFSPLRIDEDGVVLSPPPHLMAAPWAAMPSLRGASVTVSPSAEMWWLHRLGSQGGRVLVVGGPDLEMVEVEVGNVASLYDDAVALAGANVVEVADALAGASVAHIACHASFEAENPMFSSLRLNDGDLHVYDIERLENPPQLVVLSACDSGYTETRSGDELAGLTSALLSMGTRNVVASIGLVPDSSATADLMVDFHKGLIAGLEPAQALADAQGEAFEDPSRFVSAASFICVGA